jgi:hypothetical protein
MEDLIKDFYNGFKIRDCDEDYDSKIKKIPIYKMIDNSIEQLDINRIFSYLEDRNLMSVLINYSKSINSYYQYYSDEHGINHSFRVLLFSLYLASVGNLSMEDINILIEGTKYHDIGRHNDATDSNHGRKSAQKLTKILRFDTSNLNMIQAVIELHSIEDSKYDTIIRKYNINCPDRFNILYSILKDADALDRVRLSMDYDYYSSLDPLMLRLKESMKLIKASHQLNEYFVKSEKIYSKYIS